MSTLFIRLPSHAVADSLPPGTPLHCQFALLSDGGSIERNGVAPLSELAEAVKRARRVVLLLAAADVNLLRVKVPPLSAARLKAALPNLVEDKLIAEPEDCVLVAGAAEGDGRTVAVVQRNWLELLHKTLLALGAREIVALPAQLCLPLEPGSASAAIAEHDADADVALRLAPQQGIGLSIAADQHEALAFESMQALAALVPAGNIDVYVPPTRLHDYQESLRLMANAAPPLAERIHLHEERWQHWTQGAEQLSLNLMDGLSVAQGTGIDWRRWRWPLLLATALAAINLIALNVDWLRARREAQALQDGMVQSYKAAFPKETVIVDPHAQLRQKLAAAQRGGGQVAQDDFLAMAAAFSEAWSGAGQQANAIASLDYRDRMLTVKLKPGTTATTQQLAAALDAHKLTVSEQSAGTWQIRSAR